MIGMPELAADLWRSLLDQWDDLRRFVGFSAPLGNLPAWMAPGVALGALLGLALAAGIALVSLGALLTALLMAHLLLDRVFGISVAMVPPRAG
jgi:hypothetical protein